MDHTQNTLLRLEQPYYTLCYTCIMTIVYKLEEHAVACSSFQSSHPYHQTLSSQNKSISNPSTIMPYAIHETAMIQKVWIPILNRDDYTIYRNNYSITPRMIWTSANCWRPST